MAKPIPRTPPRAELWSALARSARLWWRSALWFTLIAGVVVGPATVLGLGGVSAAGANAAQGPAARLEQQLRTVLLVSVFELFAGSLAEGAIVLGVLAETGGRRQGPLRMLAAGSERYGRTLPVNAVCMAFTVGGSLLFPVFGLLFWSLSFIALPVALAEPDLPVPDVFRRTWDLSRGRRLPLLYLVTGVWALAELTGRMFEVLGKAAPGLPGWAMPSAHAVVTCLVEGFVTVVSVALYRAFAAAPPAGPAAWPR